MLEALFVIATALILAVVSLAVFGMVRSLIQTPEVPATGVTRSRSIQH